MSKSFSWGIWERWCSPWKVLLTRTFSTLGYCHSGAGKWLNSKTVILKTNEAGKAKQLKQFGGKICLIIKKADSQFFMKLVISIHSFPKLVWNLLIGKPYFVPCISNCFKINLAAEMSFHASSVLYPDVFLYR